MRVALYARVSTESQQARAPSVPSSRCCANALAPRARRWSPSSATPATPGRGWTAPEWTRYATPHKPG